MDFKKVLHTTISNIKLEGAISKYQVSPILTQILSSISRYPLGINIPLINNFMKLIVLTRSLMLNSPQELSIFMMSIQLHRWFIAQTENITLASHLSMISQQTCFSILKFLVSCRFNRIQLALLLKLKTVEPGYPKLLIVQQMQQIMK